MARLTDSDREKILSDFHIGKSQNELAKKYNCSPATINKLCKGVVPKYKDKVNTVVSIKSELSEESEYQSECFDKEVNALLRRTGIINDLTELNMSKLKNHLTENKKLEKVSVGQGMQDLVEVGLGTSDYKEAQDAIDKASITMGVNQRHSNQNINVNTQTNLQSNTQINLTEDEARKEAERLGVPLSALM
jgi:DNA-binding XRE family transcriptional regulator